MGLALGCGRGGRAAEHRGILPEEECDPIEAGADPDDLPGRTELVEQLGPVGGHAAGQDVALPQRDRQGQSLERYERLAQRRPPVDPVPARQEAAEGRLLGGLDLLAQRGQRCTAKAAQDVGVAPFALRAARPELAADELLLALERP